MPLPPDRSGTIGNFFLISTSDQPAELDRITPTGRDGIRFRSIQVHSLADPGAPVGTAYGPPDYPPGSLRPVRSSVVQPEESPGDEVQVVVNVELDPGRTDGSMSGYRVEFHVGETRYDLRSSQKIRLHRP